VADDHFLRVAAFREVGRVHVSERILEQKDGPTLEAMKELHENRIILPARGIDRPDRDRLAMRFDLFKARS